MFFNSQQFKLLETGVHVSALQQQLHTQNIANFETPGYKAKGLEFNAVLQGVMEEGQLPEYFEANIVTDPLATIRPDGNNVDLEEEGLGMYRAYIQYAALLDKINGQFTQYDYVLNANM